MTEYAVCHGESGKRTRRENTKIWLRSTAEVTVGALCVNAHDDRDANNLCPPLITIVV